MDLGSSYSRKGARTHPVSEVGSWRISRRIILLPANITLACSYGISRIVTFSPAGETVHEPDPRVEVIDDNPVFIPFCIAMLRGVGDGAGPSSGAANSTSSNHYRNVGTDAAAGFHDRAADADHDQGSRPGRNPNSSYALEPSADPSGTSPASEPEYARRALSDHSCDPNGTEWNCSRPRSKRYNRRHPGAAAPSGAGRTALKYSRSAYEQSRKQYAGKFGDYASLAESGWHYTDESSHDPEWCTMPTDAGAKRYESAATAASSDVSRKRCSGPDKGPFFVQDFANLPFAGERTQSQNRQAASKITRAVAGSCNASRQIPK